MKKASKLNSQWILTPLLKSDNDPKIEDKTREVEEKCYEFINKWKDRTDYLEDPAILKTALDEYEHLSANYGTDGDVGYYFGLRSSQDQDSPAIKAKYNKIVDRSIKIGNDIQFFTHRLAKVSPEMQKKFLEFPGLHDYSHWLELLFNEAKYLLSEPEEKILALKSVTSYSNWVRMTSSFISKEERKIKGKKDKVSFSELMKLVNDENKEMRDSAAESVNDILRTHADTAEAEINSILSDKKTNDELRNIERPDLPRHLSDDIDTEVVDALLDSVESRYDISKRYYNLKKKLLGFKKLKYHERTMPYGELNKKYSYEDAVKMVGDTFKKLDGEFHSIFEDFVNNGKIDVYPRKGKYNGAFSIHGLKTQPGYILLNHADELRDVTTLAHEMGHAINNELIRTKQNALNFDTPLSTAEVASTFMEDFVLDELEKGANDELKLAIMMMRLDDLVSSIFRQVACYKFEQELHHTFREKGYLPKEEIGKIFVKHMSNYLGPDVEMYKGTENWWVYWSHIRRYFYVYSYASGLLISKSLQGAVKEDKAFIAKVKEFLSAGTSDSPRNIFLKTGIDIGRKQFWLDGLDEIEQLLVKTENTAHSMKKI
ncbi:hypothetical protein C4561_00120 [candidate division WWE3 bacterium]|jgi:oligoendopeptidase F|uniref:Oligoendopeptidase F n=1 Tax=candidate division WWE3 bacterium TaxID=2053526 RepID=A0A3A4ZGK9_UNCKA|nr:MAG: hypothetical protein C4561_00120 [candidate division WWE3 bacterium]